MRKRHPTTTVDMRVQVGGLELASPVVAASGTFGHGAEVVRLVDPTRTLINTRPPAVAC